MPIPESTAFGLPDEATLARLASEFFRALPGGAPAPFPPGGLQPPALPGFGATFPTLPSGIADPGGAGDLRAPLQGLGPAVPPATTPPNGMPSAVSGLHAPDAVPSTYPVVPPLGAGLAGDDDLRMLIAAALPLRLTAPPSPAAGGSYYFLDHGVLDRGVLDRGVLDRGAAAPAPAGYDVEAVRRDFPILSERVNGRPLIWLDNAATTQKPKAVIDRLSYFYRHENSNIHRAAHTLAARATDAYEGARESVRRFINAASADEIVFVRGTTEAINLVAQSWGRRFIGAGDEIIITHLEHHANIVPWQQLAQVTGAKLRVVPVDDSGQVRLDEYGRLLNERTRLVSLTQVSNALGTVTPAREMTAMAHAAGARVLLDGAQSVSHIRTDVIGLDADFFVFSGHKVFGPTGIGVLYGKKTVLDAMPPWQGGGNMIRDVTFEHTEYHDAPARFEAGTGNIADAVGLGAALDYVERIGIEAIGQHEHALIAAATRRLSDISGLHIIGTATAKAGVISFVLDGFKSEEVGKALNDSGIAVRSGHHCAQPILRRFGQETTVRPSFALYNTIAEVDALAAAVARLRSGRPVTG